MISKCLLTVFAVIATVCSAAKDDKETVYDSKFWDDFDNEAPYNHTLDQAPDLVNTTNVIWWFNMTHHFLTGLGRGFYNNQSFEIDKNCFGVRQAQKINWYKVLAERDAGKHWI